MLAFLKKFYKYWMKLSHILGLVMTSFWLTIFYFIVLTPIGFFWRLIGHDPLRLKWKNNVDSYREASDILDPQHMEHPY